MRYVICAIFPAISHREAPQGELHELRLILRPGRFILHSFNERYSSTSFYLTDYYYYCCLFHLLCHSCSVCVPFAIRAEGRSQEPPFDRADPQGRSDAP